MTLSYVSGIRQAVLVQEASPTHVTGVRQLVLRSATDAVPVLSFISGLRQLILRTSTVRRDRGPVVSCAAFGWNPAEPEPDALQTPYE